jgi:formylglycine-generating enzyme required for sulfatase activity
LSERDGRAYRLPTEAEWEYACRAGTTTPFFFGETISTDQANYGCRHPTGRGKAARALAKPTPVGSFPPNAFGLYDMHGNVWERCQDWYGDYPKEAVVDPQGPEHRYPVPTGKGPEKEWYGRVYRGGQCDSTALQVRSAARWAESEYPVHVFAGFRPAMTPMPTKRGLGQRKKKAKTSS